MVTNGSPPERAARPPPRRDTMVLVVPGRLRRADLPVLAEYVRLLLERTTTDLLICDLARAREPDVVCVEALARLRLVAGRAGCRLRVRAAPEALLDLVAMLGLSEVLAPRAPRREGD